MPVGEYVLEDGKLLVVEEEGIIADMRDVSDDVPAKEEASEEEVTEELAEEAAVYDWEGMEKRIKNLEDAIADLKADKMDAPEDVKEEMTEEVKSELTEEIKERFRERLMKLGDFDSL